MRFMRFLPILVVTAAVLSTTDAASAQLRSTTGPVDVELGGRLHSQFQSSNVVGQESEFFQRRARLRLDLEAWGRISARVQPDFAGGEVNFADLWIAADLNDAITVTFGQFKRAHALFELESSTRLPVIEADGRVAGVDHCMGVGGTCALARLSTKLGYSGRDRGVKVEVSRGEVDVATSVTTGAGTGGWNDNDAWSFATRATWAITGDVTLGGGVSMHDYSTATGTSRATAFDVDAEWGDWQDGPHVLASFARGDNWKAAGVPTFVAWQVVGSWFVPTAGVIHGWEPVVRVGSGDSDRASTLDSGHVITAGLMVYSVGRNRIGVNLDLWRPDSGASARSLKIQSFIYF